MKEEDIISDKADAVKRCKCASGPGQNGCGRRIGDPRAAQDPADEKFI